jgi:hypothetical protein
MSIENEAQSEAAFQKLLASGAELPIPPTPRVPSDRGRYPEEAGPEDTREETPSDDDDIEPSDAGPFAFLPHSGSSSDLMSSTKPSTPAGSINGDDHYMLGLDSPGGGSFAAAMDVDMISTSPNLTQWRYTPPPTTSIVRSNKRKCTSTSLVRPDINPN